MSFDPGAQLDPGQISDRRGMGRRGGIAVGGGGIGLLLLLGYVLLGGNPQDLGPLLQPGNVTGPESSALTTECKTGEDANTKDDCRILGFVNSVQTYWSSAFEAGQYEPAKTVLFTDGTQSACGPASRESGPFYCPSDGLVYLDLGFFEVLRQQFGTEAGPFAQGYVVAHEYGHHVQDLTGVLGQPGVEGFGSRWWLRPHRASGRLLRRRLGEPRRSGHPGPRDPRADRRCPERGRDGRRRPDPAGDVGSDQRERLHPRHRRAAADLVQYRLRQRRAARLRHVQRRDLTGRV